MNDLPKDLGGLQNVVFGKVLEGDILIPFYGTITDAVNAMGLVGEDIQSEHVRNYFRVYRRLPVAKQGDLDHATFGASSLPTDAAARKRIPIATGFCFYFPRAMAAVAAVSLAGNEQHNPGKPLHWDRSKSSDEDDALMRHFLERDAVDKDGHLHAARCAWRAMARLEKMLEKNSP